MANDKTMKTDEMLHRERRNFLLNNIRAYFFGASLEESMQEINKLATQAAAEQKAFIDDNKKDDKLQKQIKQDKEVLLNKVDALKKIVKKLDVENPQSEKDYITNKDLEDFRHAMTGSLQIKARPKKGISEDILNSFFTNIENDVKTRCEYEIENHYDVPFAHQMLRKTWLEQIQEHITENPASMLKDTADTVEKNLTSVVDAIYKGEITLEGLKLHDYKNDLTAPQKTAGELIKTCGYLAFVNPEQRSKYLPDGGINTRDVVVEFEKYNDIDKYHELDTKYPNHMEEAWQQYNRDQNKFLDKFFLNQSVSYLDFSKLSEARENTLQKDISPEEKTNAEDALLNEYMDHLHEESIEAAKVDISNLWHAGPMAMDKDMMEKTIAAHLCSAYYRLGEGEANNKDLIVFDHRVGRPVNDKSINETIEFFKKEVFPEAKEATFSDMSIDRIKTHYDAAILNREAKAIQRSYDLDKFSAYVIAMSEETMWFSNDKLNTGATILGKMVKPEHNLYNEWTNYVANMIENNKDFQDAIAERINKDQNIMGDFKYSPQEMSKYFVAAFNERKSEFVDPGQEYNGPDIEEHNQKLADLNNTEPTYEKKEDIFKQRRSELKAKIKKDDIRRKLNSEGKTNWAQKWSDLQKKYQEKDGPTLVNLSEGEASYNAFMEKEDTKLEIAKISEMEKATLATAKKADVELTEQFKDMAEPFKKVSPDSTNQSILDNIVMGVGGSDNPQKARKNLLALAKASKRSFIKVLFGISSNATSTALRNGLNKLANLKEGETMSQAELKDLRLKALELKSMIAQGRNYSPQEEWVKDLSGLDKARYKMATTVLENTEKMMKKENNGVLKKDIEKFETKKVKKEPEQVNKQVAAKK